MPNPMVSQQCVKRAVYGSLFFLTHSYPLCLPAIALAQARQAGLGAFVAT
jgi:hypothetical protein